MTCWLHAECAAGVRHHFALKTLGLKGTMSLCVQQPGLYLSGVLFKASQRVCLRRRCQIPQFDAAIPTGRCKNIFILLCMSSCTLFTTLFMFANAALQCNDTGAALSACKVATLHLQVSGLQSAPRSMHNHRDRLWCQMQQSGLVLAVMPALDILAVRHSSSWATQH